MIMKPLGNYAKNTYSQYGEDGIIEEVLRLAGLEDGMCYDIGAWDGVKYSNVLALVERGFYAVMIEANPKRYKNLLKTAKEHSPRICAINAAVTPESLRGRCRRLNPSCALALINIDTDGDDAALFAATGGAFPVAVVEWCDHGEDKSGRVMAAAEILKYRLVARTRANMVLVTEKSFAKMNETERREATT